jgi:hypothetical protein
MWSFMSKPNKSSTTLNGATSLTPSFYADAEGVYTLQLSATTQYGTSSATVNVTATAQRQVMTYALIDVDYSFALDRFVIVSDAPPMLRVRDPATGGESTVSLPAAPNAVSVEPTGLRAAVAHNGSVSIVDLQLLSVAGNYPQTINVGNIAFGADARIHFLPRSGATSQVDTLALSSGFTVASSGGFSWGSSNMRISPNGLSMYVATPYLHPSPLGHFDVSGSPVTLLRNMPPPQSLSASGNLWFMHDGNSFLMSAGNLFYASANTSVDMTPRASLSPLFSAIAWAQDSAPNGKLVTVSTQFNNTMGGAGTDAVFALYDDQTLAFIESILLPDTPYGGTSYSNSSIYVAFRSDGSKAYVITKAAVPNMNVFALYPIDP